MSRSTRLFEIIQLLRSAERPLTAEALASTLEVTKRTIYRDIAALQARRVPIEGEAGIGYVMRPGFDLPPLMFTPEEIEAVTVGLAMLRRTGDTGLMAAAERVSAKIAEVLPDDAANDPPLHVAPWSDMLPSKLDPAILRDAIRDEEALALDYRDGKDRVTERTILPLAVTYNIETVMLLAWCELREDFRHFRVDRFESCTQTGRSFRGQGDGLRALWALEGDDAF